MITINGKAASDRAIEVEALKAHHMSVVRHSDNSGTFVNFYEGNGGEPFARAFVPNTARGFGVWLYYSQDVAAFVQRCNPGAAVTCQSFGGSLDFSEHMGQW